MAAERRDAADAERPVPAHSRRPRRRHRMRAIDRASHLLKQARHVQVDPGPLMCRPPRIREAMEATRDQCVGCPLTAERADYPKNESDAGNERPGGEQSIQGTPEEEHQAVASTSISTVASTRSAIATASSRVAPAVTM